jgi:hypothetical protein
MAQQPLYQQYLHQARRLARLDPRRPQQGNLRRAVSTAYYALFHFLVDRSSRALVGSARDREPLRHMLARAYGHSEMASAAKTFRGGNLPAAMTRVVGTLNFPVHLRNLAELLVNLQDQRHLADYDLATTLLRSNVLNLVDAVEQAITGWARIRAESAAQFFLICLLVWDKIRNK